MSTKETIPIKVSITSVEQRVTATPRQRHLPQAKHGDSSMFLAKHATPICSYIYLAWDIKKESFGEHSHLILNRVKVAVEVYSIW